MDSAGDLTEEQLNLLQGNRKIVKQDNPYLVEQQEGVLQPRKTFKGVKD
jgi:hypothetical protein